MVCFWNNLDSTTVQSLLKHASVDFSESDTKGMAVGDMPWVVTEKRLTGK